MSSFLSPVCYTTNYVWSHWLCSLLCSIYFIVRLFSGFKLQMHFVTQVPGLMHQFYSDHINVINIFLIAMLIYLIHFNRLHAIHFMTYRILRPTFADWVGLFGLHSLASWLTLPSQYSTTYNWLGWMTRSHSRRLSVTKLVTI